MPFRLFQKLKDALTVPTRNGEVERFLAKVEKMETSQERVVALCQKASHTSIKDKAMADACYLALLEESTKAEGKIGKLAVLCQASRSFPKGSNQKKKICFFIGSLLPPPPLPPAVTRTAPFPESGRPAP